MVKTSWMKSFCFPSSSYLKKKLRSSIWKHHNLRPLGTWRSSSTYQNDKHLYFLWSKKVETDPPMNILYLNDSHSHSAETQQNTQQVRQLRRFGLAGFETAQNFGLQAGFPKTDVVWITWPRHCRTLSKWNRRKEQPRWCRIPEQYLKENNNKTFNMIHLQVFAVCSACILHSEEQ